MSERPVPDEYTQTRTQFGQHAIATARAVQAILGGLIPGYETLNNLVPPGGHGTSTSGTSTGGTKGQGSSSSTAAEDESEDSKAFHRHNPYFLHDAIKALDELISVTEKRYL